VLDKAKAEDKEGQKVVFMLPDFVGEVGDDFEGFGLELFQGCF